MARTTLLSKLGPISAFVAALTAWGCASVSPALAPLRTPSSSALELESYVRERPGAHLAYGPRSVLRTQGHGTLTGHEAIQAFLSSTDPATPHAFEFFTGEVYRCGADRGIEIGRYRYREARRQGVIERGGSWFARWRRETDGHWAIEEGILGAPGSVPPHIDPGCTSAEEESAARSRLILSIQPPPFGWYSAEPHAELAGAGRYTFAGTTRIRRGWMGSGTLRLSDRLATGLLFALEPSFRSQYKNIFTLDREWLTSDALLVAATAGYQGRNVTLEAGPAWVRSRWAWGDGSGLPRSRSTSSHFGALIGVRIRLLQRSDIGLELLTQYRFLAPEEVPGAKTDHRATRSGAFIGLGLGLRRAR